MRETIALRFLFFLLLLIIIPTSKANTCICQYSFAEATTNAKAIFIGKVIGIDKDRYWLQGKPKSVFTFQVFESFKGLNKHVGIISVIAPIGDCEIGNFRKDSIYLMVAYSDCNDCEILWTNDCANSGLLSKKRDLIKKLGTSTKHTNPYNTENTYDLSILDAAFITEALTTKIATLEQEIQTINTSKKQRDYLIIILGAIILTLLVYLVLGRRK
jgi:hypothetical protein